MWVHNMDFRGQTEIEAMAAKQEAYERVNGHMSVCMYILL